MLLVSGELTVFMNFLQVFLWITLPLLLLAAAITTFFHYRKRHSRKGTNEMGFTLALAGEGMQELPPIPQGHHMQESLKQLSQFRNKLFFSTARYSVLKKEMETLETKYNDLLASGHTNNNNNLEISPAMMDDLQAQLAKTERMHQEEKEELVAHLDVLNHRNSNLEEENKKLREQVGLHQQGSPVIARELEQWQEERSQLKKRLASLESLEDILEEKKLQIEFLQQQLDNRIRSYYELEQQFADTTADFMSARAQKESLENELAKVQDELQERNRADRELQDLFEQKNILLSELRQENTEKEEELKQLKERIAVWEQKETEQEAMLQVIEHERTQLKEDIHRSELRAENLAQRLEEYRHAIGRLHQELLETPTLHSAGRLKVVQ